MARERTQTGVIWLLTCLNLRLFPLEGLTTASVSKRLKDHLFCNDTGFIGLLLFLNYTPQNKTGSRWVESTV